MSTNGSIGAASKLWRRLSLPEETLKRLHFTGDSDRAVDSSFLSGTAAQACVGLSGLSAAQLHALRTGQEQDVTVDARHAALAFHTEAFFTTNVDVPRALWDSIAGLYKTKDNNYVRIHTNFPHHRRGILNILNIADTASITRSEVQDALLHWNSMEFETEVANKGMCATAMRSFEQWDQHPQSKALIGVPPVEVRKIGDAPKRVVSSGTRPLDGIRVLDLSRVLAGPVCGRTLAAHGADVLLITSPNLPSLPNLDIETSLGKRTTQINLEDGSGKDTLRNLAKGTDVFLQAYRPGGLEEKGFGAQELAKLRPGIVCANLRAWGWDGPWESRRGFDSLVQTATGFNFAEGEAYQVFEGESENANVKPRPFPMQAIDFAAGYLLAFGINAALCKTITEGGSWEVRVSLAAIGQWIRSLGRNPGGFTIGRPFPKIGEEEIENLSVTWKGNDGDRWIRALKHPAVLSLTPVREGEDGIAPLTLDAHDSVWKEI